MMVAFDSRPTKETTGIGRYASRAEGIAAAQADRDAPRE